MSEFPYLCLSSHWISVCQIDYAELRATSSDMTLLLRIALCSCDSGRSTKENNFDIFAISLRHK